MSSLYCTIVIPSAIRSSLHFLYRNSISLLFSIAPPPKKTKKKTQSTPTPRAPQPAYSPPPTSLLTTSLPPSLHPAPHHPTSFFPSFPSKAPNKQRNDYHHWHTRKDHPRDVYSSSCMLLVNHSPFSESAPPPPKKKTKKKQKKQKNSCSRSS